MFRFGTVSHVLSLNGKVQGFAVGLGQMISIGNCATFILAFSTMHSHSQFNAVTETENLYNEQRWRKMGILGT